MADQAKEAWEITFLTGFAAACRPLMMNRIRSLEFICHPATTYILIGSDALTANFTEDAIGPRETRAGVFEATNGPNDR